MLSLKHPTQRKEGTASYAELSISCSFKCIFIDEIFLRRSAERVQIFVPQKKQTLVLCVNIVIFLSTSTKIQWCDFSFFINIFIQEFPYTVAIVMTSPLRCCMTVGDLKVSEQESRKECLNSHTLRLCLHMTNKDLATIKRKHTMSKLYFTPKTKKKNKGTLICFMKMKPTGPLSFMQKYFPLQISVYVFQQK